MSELLTTVTHYHGCDRQVDWHGIGYEEGDAFSDHLKLKVAPRVRDDEGNKQFEAALRGVATTGFANDSLRVILDADEPETRDWAIGESLAEAHLSEAHGVTWPWNTERDKRNPAASLPGADLVGLKSDELGPLFAMGEVKCSSESATPPQVMSGRSGMVHQLDTIAGDLSILGKLLKWLFFRCNNTPHEEVYKQAAKRLLHSSNRSIALFGVLIRDTIPNERDLDNRGRALSGKLQAPTSCVLIALHLPFPIADLPTRCAGGAL